MKLGGCGNYMNGVKASAPYTEGPGSILPMGSTCEAILRVSRLGYTAQKEVYTNSLFETTIYSQLK